MSDSEQEAPGLFPVLTDIQDQLSDVRDRLDELDRPPDDGLLTREEAADRLRISVRKLDDLADAGRLQPIRIDRRVLYPSGALDAFVQQQSRRGSR